MSPGAAHWAGPPGHGRPRRPPLPWDGRPRRPPLPWDGRPRRPPLPLAVAVALVQCLGTTFAAPRQDAAWIPGWSDHPMRGLAYGLLVASALALVARRRAPRATLVAALVPTTAYYASAFPSGPGFLAATVAVFAAIMAGHRVLAWAAVAVAYAGYAALAYLGSGVGVGRILTTGAWALVCTGFAEALRVRAANIAAMARARTERERAAAEQRRAAAEQRRARQEQERRQVSEERLRIARELHDVIGHHLSLINVQAGVGLHLMGERPEQARESLAAIKHASAEALREVRSVLAALQADDSAPRAPAPALADVDRLVADASAAGLPVRLTVDGVAGPLPAEVGRAAYRIVREALTNVRRHAGAGASATVAIGYGGQELSVVVTDDGGTAGGAPTAGAGSGIAGMRERAAAVGGTVSAGPTPAGGFEVRAALPLVHGEEMS